LALAAVILYVGCAAAFAQDTVPVLFSGPVERVRYKLYLDDVFVGLMGDAVNAPLGLHRVSIEGPYGAWLDMNLKFGVGSIGNEGVSVRRSCNEGPEFVESWPWSYEPLADRTIVHIQRPVIGRRTPDQCPRARLPIARTLGRVNLAVQSSPTGAEILIDGGTTGKTPRKIAVPYNEHTSLITVVVRSDGYVNCRAELRPPFPEEREIDCRLQRF
jgi:hypothetical protein